MINSLESQQLDSLIKQKTKRYKEIQEKEPDNPALLYLNSEITFLRDVIMPIILEQTTVDYSELRTFVTRSLRRLEQHPLARKTTDLIIHLHLKDPDGKSVAAISSNGDRYNLDINFDNSNLFYI